MNTEQPYSHCTAKRIKVCLAPIEPNERIEWIYSILEIMHASRFGPHRYRRVFEQPDHPWTDDVIYDLLPAGPLPFIASESLKEKLLKPVESDTAGSGFENLFRSPAAGQPSPLTSPRAPARGSPRAALLG